MLFCPLFIQIQKISFIQIIALFRTVVEAKNIERARMHSRKITANYKCCITKIQLYRNMYYGSEHVRLAKLLRTKNTYQGHLMVEIYHVALALYPRSL